MDNVMDYIKLLQDSLDKKLELLQRMHVLVSEQSKIVSTPELDMDKFDETMDKKSELIKSITIIDDGFNGIYDRVRVEIKENTEQYKSDIAYMKSHISKITGLSVEIQIMEQANKALLENHFTNVKTKIRKFNKGSKQSLAYYKNAHSGIIENSYIMDEKN
ncbi:MAG: hypothetical protein K0R15_2174 [Clostridiales bacterium]|jgi:flagellar biosynthesis/type III secretory pathway chaperone|nr:hypothetical protein [Clostridiales bacterium]